MYAETYLEPALEQVTYIDGVYSGTYQDPEGRSYFPKLEVWYKRYPIPDPKVVPLKVHRDEQDGPAIIQTFLDGSTREVYCRDGVIHRENGPAVISDVLLHYLQNGKLYRENGPTIVFLRNHKHRQGN